MSVNPSRSPRVLAFGTYDERLHPRIRTILEGLEQHGFVIRDLNRPLGMSTADKVAMLQRPWRLPLFAARLIGKWVELAAGSLRYRRRKRPDFLVVGYMGHFDVLLARLLFPRTTIVLDHLIFAAGTARDRGTRPGLKTRILEGLDRIALNAANIIATDTEEHLQQVPESLRSRAVVVPVGAPAPWFAARERRGKLDATSRSLRVIFFGLFTPLQGAAVIAEGVCKALEQGADLDVTIVGDGQDAPSARKWLSDKTIDWRPWVEPEKLPALVASNDVCLGIFGTTPKALAVVPNKVYQGAAAGCTIITSDTPPQRRMLQNSAIFVPPGDAATLADVLVELSRTPDSAFAQRATEFADEHFTAVSVVRDLVDCLECWGRQ